jgi:hypothetical protein
MDLEYIRKIFVKVGLILLAVLMIAVVFGLTLWLIWMIVNLAKLSW